MPTSLSDTFSRLATRDNRRTEAEIQADVRQFRSSRQFLPQNKPALAARIL